jgi:hypothetical protein
MPTMPALGKLQQKDEQFEDSLSYSKTKKVKPPELIFQKQL